MSNQIESHGILWVLRQKRGVKGGYIMAAVLISGALFMPALFGVGLAMFGIGK